MRLDGLALVTGGSSGIGKQLAADLLRRGARVVICSERPDRVARAVDELGRVAPRVHGIACDVGDTPEVARMAAEVERSHGCPDILVNCAGFATYRSFEGTDIAEIERLIEVNLLGAMRCARAFLPSMIARRSGAILNVASIAGRMIITPNATYGAAKHGMVAWSEALRYELARFGIQVNVVCPGRVETPFFDHETFRTRAPRRETRHTVGVEDVSRDALAAVARNRFLTYTPRTLGLLAWLLRAFPFLLRPLYGRLLTRRIDALYEAGDRS